MIRLIKICFWIAVVVFFLPEDATNDITTQNAIEMARAGAKDISSFCTRNPDACLQGKQAVANLSQKTINTARSIYDYLQENSSKDVKNDLEQVINQSEMLSIEEQIKLAQTKGQTLSVSDLNIDFSSLSTQ
ncbi:MAG: hypothetical protein COB24_00465 [Hyphomicrobiales bacterium]|nr:MAG: hypothetical protein COB24_00465 [Hyphomicrobiales bacterium]